MNPLLTFAHLLVFVVLTGSAAWSARQLRQAFGPAWPPALGALADCIGALFLLIALSEALGTGGQFRLVPVVAGSVLLAGVSTRLRRRRRPAGTAPASEHAASRLDLVVAASSAALVGGQWATWVATSYEFGIGNAGGPGSGDSLWYHMPLAAQFVQTGWTTHAQFTSGEALTSYYPANTAVLHALVLMSTRTDFLSVFLNLALAGMALLAGWCIGEGFGLGPASLAGVAVALTLPAVVTSEAGTAKDDVLGLVGLLAAVAFLVHPQSRHRQARAAGAAFGGLAAGLAIGSKLTMVVPAAALVVLLVVLSPKGWRRQAGVCWGGGAALAGGYWYLRNLVLVGNPLPGLRLGVGGYHLPRPPTPSQDIYGSSLLHSITNLTLWREALLPGLGTGFGTGWPIIAAVLGLAVVLGLARLRGTMLAAPVVTAVSLAAFVVTPGTVWGRQFIGSAPYVRFITSNLFSYNLRYMLPAVAIGLTIVPLVVRRWPRAELFVIATLGLALAATELGSRAEGSWSRGHVLAALWGAALALAIVAAAMTGLARRARQSLSGRPKVLTAMAVVAIAVLSALAVHADTRYQSHNRYGGLTLARWAATVSGARIGYSGFVFSYPLYGPHLDNVVTMVGRRGPKGAWHPVRSCAAWRRTVRQMHLDYVVVPVGGTEPGLGIDLSRWKLGLPGGEPPDEPPESYWTRHDPGAKVVVAGDGAAVYSIAGPPSTSDCRP